MEKTLIEMFTQINKQHFSLFLCFYARQCDICGVNLNYIVLILHFLTIQWKAAPCGAFWY